MKKLLSFILILSLLLTLSFPAAQAGTITQAIKTATAKIDYITAGEFVTSLLLGAKVKPNGIADYWGKAVSMGLIPAEVKKDKPLTRAQASYIVWQLINAVPELKDKNIPVSVRRVPPTEAFMRGICFFGGPVRGDGYVVRQPVVGYDLDEFIQGYQLLVMEYKYSDSRTEIKYVWDRYKGISITRENYVNSNSIFLGLLDEFKKKSDKVVYAPRPYQKGWLFTIDPMIEAQKLKYPIYNVPETSFDLITKKYVTSRWDVDTPEKAVEILLMGSNAYEHLGLPLTRRDMAEVTYLYHTRGMEEFKGNRVKYNIKEHPYFNMYFEDFLMNYPRKYPTDHTRFAYYCKDYSSIPQLYRDSMLHLADLGIITPDQSALYVGVYYFNPAKMLTRSDAVQMISKVFDKKQRDVLDEVTVKQTDYWEVKNEIGLGYERVWKQKGDEYYSWAFDKGPEVCTDGLTPASPVATFRIEEPMAMSLQNNLQNNTFRTLWYGVSIDCFRWL